MLQCEVKTIGKKTTTDKVTYAQLPQTAQQQQLATMVVQPTDPSLAYSYAQRREDVNNSMHSLFGAHTSPAVRDAAARVANKRMTADENAAIQAQNAQNAQGQFNRQAVVADLSKPVQTGGSRTESGGFWTNLLLQGLSAGANAGVSAMQGMGGGGAGPKYNPFPNYTMGADGSAVSAAAL